MQCTASQLERQGVGDVRALAGPQSRGFGCCQDPLWAERYLSSEGFVTVVNVQCMYCICVDICVVFC